MIPTWNQSLYLRDAIHSALAQTYPNLEVIVGDDASDDATAEMASHIHDPRLKYVRHPVNLGRTGNYRALLYQHATGDYVVNLDGDDYFTDPDFIASAVRVIANDQRVVMVVARARTGSGQKSTVSQVPPCRELTGLQLVCRLPGRQYMLMHMAVLYARKQALALDFYRSDAISSDWESLYRLSLLGLVRYLDRDIGVWRQHATNTTGTIDPIKLLANLRIWEAIYIDAHAAGMGKWQANIACARCVVTYASASCIQISRWSRKKAVAFLISMVKEFGRTAFFFLVYPRCGFRVVLVLLGYYRPVRPQASEHHG